MQVYVVELRKAGCRERLAKVSATSEPDARAIARLLCGDEWHTGAVAAFFKTSDTVREIYSGGPVWR